MLPRFVLSHRPKTHLFRCHVLFRLCLLVLVFAGCARQPLYQQESFVFGTRVEVLVWGADEDKARAAVVEVLREFDRLHRMLHAWQPSELMALNQAIAGGRSNIPVSAELAQILGDASRLAAESKDFFNPAIGRLIALWGFHNDTFRKETPDAVNIQHLVAAHPRMVDVSITQQSVSSRNPNVQLDLGGYAKGYALDRAVLILRRHGIKNGLINIGGNVLALGSKGGAPWRVGIQHPREATPLAILSLYDGEAVGTSGDYQRYFESGGQRYSHLIDPNTGYPAQGTQAVTVLVTPREHASPGVGVLSDVGSKPIFIDHEHWRARARDMGLKHVLRIDRNGRIIVTRAMRARLTFEPGTPEPQIVE